MSWSQGEVKSCLGDVSLWFPLEIIGQILQFFRFCCLSPVPFVPWYLSLSKVRRHHAGASRHCYFQRRFSMLTVGRAHSSLTHQLAQGWRRPWRAQPEHCSQVGRVLCLRVGYSFHYYYFLKEILLSTSHANCTCQEGNKITCWEEQKMKGYFKSHYIMWLW